VTEDITNNNLNYNSADNDNGSDSVDNNVGVRDEYNDALQKELAALKQKELQQHDENQQLRDELAKLKALIETTKLS
jgi:hypothetical protein